MGGPDSACVCLWLDASGTEKSDSDIDLMVVGSVVPAALVLPLRQARDVLGREFNPTVYLASEFDAKRSSKDHCLAQVLSKPRLVVLGTRDDLGPTDR